MLAEDPLTPHRTVALVFKCAVFTDGKHDLKPMGAFHLSVQQVGRFFNSSDSALMEISPAALEGFFIGEIPDCRQGKVVRKRHGDFKFRDK